MSRTIAVAVYDGVRLLDATAPMEVFSTALELGGGYELVLCSPDGGPVTTSAGTSLTAHTSYANVRGAHTVLVPGSARLPQAPAPPELVSAIPDFAAGARRIASVCTGAFALAQAGVLDGRRATTHWRHAATLARAHPRVTVEPDAIYVRDDTVYTSAGVSAGIDLALALVEADEGAELARDVARDLVVFLQRPGGQSQFSVAARLPRPRHDPLRALLDDILADPAADHSLPAMAARAALSVRHLTRLFREHLDTTPAAFVEAVRLEAAQTLLESGESIARTAHRCGLGSEESLRRAFLRHLGVTPSAYRARFRTALLRA
ncbi:MULTISPECIES: GlxA family transcriptional regulator [unclassified Nocardia]|uniref:GlxA family transcriptional regulator n=1 Tax=unclassified Nocardia TaxID=2637762 RepID=UPI00278C6C69|nr:MULTISPECIES: GlxA family transcriptional regulator [unclassified Nocardia]